MQQREIEIAMSGNFAMIFGEISNAPADSPMRMKINRHEAALFRPTSNQSETLGNTKRGFEFLVSMAGSCPSMIPQLLLGSSQKQILKELEQNQWQFDSNDTSDSTICGQRTEENFVGKWTVSTTLIIRKSDNLIRTIRQESRMNPEDKVFRPIEHSAIAYRRLGAEYIEKMDRKWKEETFLVTELLVLSQFEVN